MIKVVRTNSTKVAWSVSFLWFKRVFVGTPFHTLPLRVRKAILIHEFAHCSGHHTEFRILALICPPLIRWLCLRQEYAADAAVVRAGYGPELMWMLRHDNHGGPFHPSNFLRRQKMVHNKFFERPTTRVNRTVGVTD